MKRMVAYLLVGILLLLSVLAVAEEEIFIEDDGGAVGIAGGEAMLPDDDLLAGLNLKEPDGVQKGTEVIIGSTTSPSGYFTTDMWGNNSVDMDVRALIHGYATITYNGDSGMAINETVVTDFKGEEDANGDQTFTMTLSNELRYNDGSVITAKDYLFSLLLTGSPLIRELGGMEAENDHIVGFDAYRAGTQKQVSGLRLLSDTSFSITIKGEYRNYFYALALLHVTPYPMQVIAPGCDILDDGEGAYIAPSAEAQSMDAQDLGFTPGEFGKEMLAATLLDPETGYVFYPRVTCGAYSLTSYDPETHVARFTANEQYIGNFEGQKPHIETVTVMPVSNENMMEKLAAGEVTILNKVTNGLVVNEGLPMVQDGDLAMGNYLRTGFAFLSFACEEGMATSEAVRHAISYCIDQEAFVSSMVGSFSAMAVYGYYGLGQWMTGQTFDAEDEKPALDIMQELELLKKPYDILAARELLIADGWVLGEDGEPYQEGSGEVRYRQGEEGLIPLIIRWAKTEESTLADAVRETLEFAFRQIGIGLDITEMPFTQVLEHYYRQEERTYDMFFLASNFSYIFDPYYEYNTDDMYQGLHNTTGLRDDELMAIAQDMRETRPTELRAYTEKWLAFQQRWVELMPMIPLYSNVYFDFFDPALQDYDIASHTTWAEAILYVWMNLEGEEVPEA